FRHQYFHTHALPALNQFRNEGVFATEGMQATFSTMTYPNHISIVTGSRDEGQWSDPKVEPIWITATKQGMSNVKQIIRPFFEKYIDPSMVEENIIVGGQFSVIPREGQTQQVIDGLRRIPNVTVYKRNELPQRFHYSKPDHRLGEVFVIPNEGVIFLNVSVEKY
ncbi:unnamed protein product, partial [Rotaria sp. Silwood1]